MKLREIDSKASLFMRFHPDKFFMIPDDFEPKPDACYENAFVLWRYNPECVLVHGIATCSGGDHKGFQMGHAWLLNGPLVLDPNYLNIFWASDYYEAGEITYSRAYTLGQAMALLKSKKTYGPWCSRIKRALHAGDQA
jgi:hypothetical protein